MHHRRPVEGDRPLVVSPSRACQMLDCGQAHLYQLLKAGELKSYQSGKSRKILTVSIEEYVERMLADAAAGRPGRPRKYPIASAVTESPTPRAAKGPD
jgi:excisionase family DNA binding protein